MARRPKAVHQLTAAQFEAMFPHEDACAAYLVARRWPLLYERAVPCGAAYGLLLYVIMNYIVVPLSAAGHGGAKDPLWVGLSIVVHAVLIGIPIALFTRRALRPAS